MSFIENFLSKLDIQEGICFSEDNEVTLFGLWKVEIDDPKYLKIHQKTSFGEWVEVEHCDCHIPLFIECGQIIFDGRHSTNFEEMLEFEHSLINWKKHFIEVVNTKLCILFDEVNQKRTHYINKKILNFIHSKMSEFNVELLSLLVEKLHNFFQNKFFSVKPLVEVYPYALENIRISTLINLSIHTEAIRLYNHFLPNHLAIAKFIHISPDLLNKIEGISYSSKMAFAKLILSHIDDRARFDNDDLSFFINCDHLTIRQFSTDRNGFIPWLKFFAKVAKNCRFTDIHLLFREFMRIGYKGCVKNRRYVEALFSFFQCKSFQNNTYDLSYAINYSLIVNSINWNCTYSGNTDNYINNLDCSIDDIRKSDVFRAFMRFDNGDTHYLKSGCTYQSAPTEYVNELLINCHILVGLDWSDTHSSDMGFVLQRVGDSYVLSGFDNQPDRSYYHTIIVGDEVDVAYSSSFEFEGYLEEVILSYAV